MHCKQYLTNCVYILESRIVDFCTAGSISEAGKDVYLKNQDYPSAFRPTDTGCSCSVQTNLCNAKVTVNAIDLRLTDVGNTCTDTQKVSIDDKGSIITYTCSQNTNFEPSSLYTSSKNYIKVQLDHPDAINEGQLWLWFEGIVFTFNMQTDKLH